MDYLEKVKILESKTSRKQIQTEIQKCKDNSLKIELELKAKYIGLNEFFPTPFSVCEFIMKNISLPYGKLPQDYKILEPSAGTGSFADNMIYLMGWNKQNFDIIELNKDFQDYLKQKEYNLIDTDCINCQKYNHYDLLIMNPPFEFIKEHLEHCLKLLKPKSQFICIAPKMFPKQNEDFINKYEIGILYLNDNSFKSSCTNVATCLLYGYKE